MDAFKYEKEPPNIVERYGDSGFGRGCLMARRLVEVGVPFVEVNFGGWDNHQNIFDTLRNDKLPRLDQAMSALVEDLNLRGMLQDTVIIWMGEFGRTPRINGNGGKRPLGKKLEHCGGWWSIPRRQGNWCDKSGWNCRSRRILLVTGPNGIRLRSPRDQPRNNLH